MNESQAEQMLHELESMNILLSYLVEIVDEDLNQRNPNRLSRMKTILHEARRAKSGASRATLERRSEPQKPLP
ncbi:MAG: hypothetical protein ACRD9L_10815 [Bryobacteraceae bacterium]